ncbi:MAG: hypothetical protein ACK56I_30840, partial [bacterium]
PLDSATFNSTLSFILVPTALQDARHVGIDPNWSSGGQLLNATILIGYSQFPTLACVNFACGSRSQDDSTVTTAQINNRVAIS